MYTHRGIIGLLLLSLLVACFTLTDYGESWDELPMNKYADQSLTAYQTWMLEGTVNITRQDLGTYGPAFLMLDELLFRFLRPILPLNPPDVFHLIQFIIFLAGVWALYDIGIRWLPVISATGAALLLVTQPLFWGHAFMNSKDVPFFAFFLLSLAFGFSMMDSYKPVRISAPSDRIQRMLWVLTAIWLVSVIGLFAFTDVIHNTIENLVRSAAAGNANNISLVADHIHGASPEEYIQRFFILFLKLRAAYTLSVTALLGFLYYRYSRSTLQAVLPILVPGMLLGFTTSTRILGPFAGLIVAAYGFRNRGRDALPVVAIYGLIAIAVTYLTWPYLWEDPVGRFLESIRVMSSYPWYGTILFNGQSYLARELPYFYLPVLLGIQLTEPVWFLFLLGFVLATLQVIKRQEEQTTQKSSLLELTLIWFVIPVLGFILFQTPIYDNFRQLLFLLPPVFLMAGVVFSSIKRPVLQVLLIALVVLPGILDGIRLHPYEYVYYNRFVGGVSGAQDRFELDYWATSYREAAEFVNSVAPGNSVVWVEGPAHIFRSYARKDLKVLDALDPTVEYPEYYAVALMRYNLDELVSPGTETIHTVSVEGAPLTVIKAAGSLAGP